MSESCDREGSRECRALPWVFASGLVAVLTIAAGSRAWAQGQPPPELALPRVVVVGVDTLRIGGVKAQLPVLESRHLASLAVSRSATAPVAARTGIEMWGGPSLLLSVMGGAARTLDWHVGVEHHVGESSWSVRGSRAASREADVGLGSWWNEEIVASGGGRARVGLRWRRVGYRSGSGVRHVSLARPWVEWCGTARFRAGWAGGSTDASWRDVWWTEVDLPLHESLLLHVRGQTGAGIGVRATGRVGWNAWQFHMGLGSLVRDDGTVEWLAEGQGRLGVTEAGVVWVAGRRRALFRDAYSLLLDAPYTTEEENDWTWAEVREEAELGVAFSHGPVEGEASAGGWKGRDHPQWESEQRCARVDAKGAVLGIRVRWRTGVLEAEGSFDRLFSDVVGQEGGAYYTPVHRWSMRAGVRLGPGDFAVLADGAGSRPTGAGDLGSYVRVGFEAHARLTTAVSLTARGTNLFDEEYQLWEGYPLPGSRIVAGFEVNL